MKKIPSKKITPTPPKFNMIWVYIAIIAGFFALNFLYSGSGTKEITYEKFEQDMLLPGDVQKIVALKNGSIYEVEVYIKPEKLKDDPKYKEVAPADNKIGLGSSQSPQYVFTEGSADILNQKLSESQSQLPEGTPRLSPQWGEKSNPWGGIISFVLPLVIIIAIWMFLMRRMGGGGAGGGQIFNIGKSKAQLFDKESQINITFNDVAGLEEAKT